MHWKKPFFSVKKIVFFPVHFFRLKLAYFSVYIFTVLFCKSEDKIIYPNWQDNCPHPVENYLIFARGGGELSCIFSFRKNTLKTNVNFDWIVFWHMISNIFALSQKFVKSFHTKNLEQFSKKMSKKVLPPPPQNILVHLFWGKTWCFTGTGHNFHGNKTV